MKWRPERKAPAWKTAVLLLASFLIALTLPVSQLAIAAESPVLTVAVASNFLQPAKELTARYEDAAGVKVEIVTSSTGKLFAQINSGAPFAVFLAADALRPTLLHDAGKCLTPFVYAVGRVVLWTGRPELFDRAEWTDFFQPAANGYEQSTIRRAAQPRKIAMAQPQLAPYGESARKALVATGLWRQAAKNMVFGQNVAQAFQFAASGAADLAFTATSFALGPEGARGRFWPLKEAEPVVQQGCVVTGMHEDEAALFVAFLLSKQSVSLLREYGYEEK